MESCLTLLRSIYTRDEEKISSFIMEHPSPAKDKIMSKILANMMVTCQGQIDMDQVNYIQ